MCSKSGRCCKAVLRIGPLVWWFVFFGLWYFVFLYGFCGHVVATWPEAAVYLLLWNVLYFLLFWSLFYTAFAKSQPIPEVYKLDEEILRAEGERRQQLLRQLVETRRLNAAMELTFLGNHWTLSVMFCEKCGVVKAWRTRHCSECDRCVARMDHHCPIVGNCVQRHNHKSFLLFLFYATTICLFGLSIAPQYLLGFWRTVDFDDDKHFPRSQLLLFTMGMFCSAGCVVSVWCAVVLTIFTSAQLGSIAVNMTTIDSLQYSTPEGRWQTPLFDLGDWKANWCQVVGRRPLFWFLPFDTALLGDVDSPAPHFAAALPPRPITN